jgi:hypothetical protein
LIKKWKNGKNYNITSNWKQTRLNVNLFYLAFSVFSITGAVFKGKILLFFYFGTLVFDAHISNEKLRQQKTVTKELGESQP